jgi:hypothetical protein
MSERSKPRALVRERIADGNPPTGPLQAIDRHQKYLRERQEKKLGGSPILCNHNVPWVDCTVCSRPVKK